MNYTKRLATVAVAAAAILSASAIAAAPAHAARSDDCANLMRLSDWNFRMYQWAVAFYGADSMRARDYLRGSSDAVNDWVGAGC